MDNNTGGSTRKFDTAAVLQNGKGAALPSAPAPRRRRGGRKKKRGIVRSVLTAFLNILLTLFLIGIITGAIVVSVFAFYIKNNLIEDYDIVGLETNLEQTTKIYYTDASGQLVELSDQRLHGTENRSWVSVAKMPTNLKNAFIAIEDERFYTHNGVDLKRTAGAVLEFVKGNSSYGGSTITQQLIKNFSGDNEATIQRKIKEIFRAISLTKKRSKDEILEMYLNTINLSNGCYGVQAAANYLFGKDVSELSLVECASLAAIPKSPYKYNPKSHPDFNKERRETVLYKMNELGWITDKEYEEALNTELVLNITDVATSEAGIDVVTSYFTDALIEEIAADLTEQYGYPRSAALNVIFNGGLEIHTTVDPKIQQILEEVYADPNTFAKVEGVQPESAMVILDPYTGDVKGLVGGRGEKTISRGFNRATMSKRQVGSSIKPITVYAPAMDLGYINYATVIDDTPFRYDEKKEDYWPENAGRAYRGKTTVEYAIRQSLNTIAVKTLDMITPEYAYYFAKEKLGIESLETSDIDYSPLALGGLTRGLTVMEMAGAYTIFPNDGIYSAPRLYTEVLDNQKNTLLRRDVDQTVAISRSTAQVMTKLLENVVVSGTGAKVDLEKKVDTAGKTGSTNSDKDLYFVGYTPYYVGAAWFGYDKEKYIPKSVFPDNPAMLAWNIVMNRIHDDIIAEGMPLKEFDEDEIVKAEYCAMSGKKPTDLCRDHDPRGSQVETGWFKKGAEPRTECDVHVAVEFCPESNAVATEYCPKEGRKTFALIDTEDRDFFVNNLYVEDTQYTFRKLPEGFVPNLTGSLPYYAALAPEEMFVGTSNVDYPFNRICTVHTKPIEPEPVPPESGGEKDPGGDTGEDADTPGKETPEDRDEPNEQAKDDEAGKTEGSDGASHESGDSTSAASGMENR